MFVLFEKPSASHHFGRILAERRKYSSLSPFIMKCINTNTPYEVIHQRNDGLRHISTKVTEWGGRK